MEQRGWPVFLGMMALLMAAGVPIVRTTAVDSKKDQQADVKEEPPKKDEKEADKKPPHTWCEIASIYGEYFGTGGNPDCREQEGAWLDLEEILTTNKPPNYDLSFLIATVPEPLDSFLPANFDQALQGIQQAYASSGYLLDRMWLPWNDKKLVSSKVHRHFPGLLLFRRTGVPQSELATVLLVGESPKSGIHKEAFQNAVRLASTFGKDPQEIPVLGPSFSGSDESLRLSLESAATNAARFHIATGTATAEGLEWTLRLPEISDFCRTVIPDSILQEEALQHLRREMGWDRRRVANLVEADTAYGGQFLFRARSKWKDRDRPAEPRKGLGQKLEHAREGPLWIEFPSGISDLRVAWERHRSDTSQAQAVLKEPKWALDLNLAGKETPADLVPKLSPLSVQDNDLALANLLRSISREQVSYVGILASDVRDKLFLAKQVQRFLPDVVLFTLEGDLLYGHPEVGEAMDGMLVFSSAPLTTEGQLWLPSWGLDAGQRRQFSSEFHRGFFQAMSYLLSKEHEMPSPRPQVWISAIGNGAVWPLAHIPISDEQKSRFQFCGAPMTENLEFRDAGLQEAAERRDLQILLVLGTLILLARGLSKMVVPPDLVQTFSGRGGGAKIARAKAWALALGVAVLWISGASLVALGLMPWRVRSFHAVSEIFTVMLGLGYIFLVWNLGRVAWPSFEPAVYRFVQGRQKPILPVLVWFLLGLLIPVLLAWGLWCLANSGGPELFYFRSRAFSSGLSPFVSLSWLGGAFYIWACLELLRYRALVRHLAEWPLQGYSEPSLRRLPETVKELGEFLRGTLGPNWTFLAGAAIALLPPVVLIGKTVQPIAEPKDYGRAFLALCFVSLILSAVSFQRFWKIWRLLEKVLQRLEHSPLVGSFQNISGQVAWNPMKSFWQVPVFNVLLLSLEKLHKIARHEEAQGDPERAEALKEPVIRIEESLDDAFEARRKRDIRDEIKARWDIQDTLLDLCKELALRHRDPLVQEFLSLRVVSYIRHVFSHMRSSLLAAMLCSFLTLMAMNSYAFEPKQFASLAIWTVILLGVALTVWTFIQMDRNAVLSAISGTKPGQVTFNRSFVLNILTYGILPVVGVVVTQFPHFGSMVVRWLNPLLQVAGID